MRLVAQAARRAAERFRLDPGACRDYYHPQLPGGTDPDLYDLKGTPNRDGTYSRVRRGGAWIESESFCRSACRLRYESHRRSDHIGFRVVVVERASS